MERGFSENEIRPDVLKDEQAALFAADVADLLQGEAEFVAVACPACGSANSHERFLKAGFRYAACSACETTFMSPRPTAEILQEYYRTSRNYTFWARRMFPASQSARAAHIARPRVDLLEKLCALHEISRSRFVEVGAGDGTFCVEVKNRRLFERVIAIEPTPVLAAACRQSGIEVIEQPLESARQAGASVNVVASFETIEHVFDPEAFLACCHAMLAPGGLLLLTCPNVKGFDVTILEHESDTFDAEHLNYFHPESLSHLLRRSGFRVLELSTPGKLDAELVRNKVLAGRFNLDGRPFLKSILIDNWECAGGAFQEFLSAHGLSSHMMVAACKAAS